MLDQLQASDFAPLLNTTMTLHFSQEINMPVELMEVKEVRGETPLQRKPFSITVRAPQTTHYYEQTICQLDHPEKGPLQLFFVPIGFDGKGMLYEAAFS